ncbi:integrase [Massilia sp. DWR3-1-1]|uniref:integrase n=1 Tax=Massilia sp. DWR3-1-1 TaxID=2804559 RepID=UPI003CEAF5EA
MATFRQRSGKWQARVRIKGCPDETKSFDTKSAAQRWARQVESSWDRGENLVQREGSELLLKEILQRYVDEVTPLKRGAKREAEGIAFMQRHKFAAFSMAKLSPAVIASYRDHRLKTVGAGTIIREMSILSSVINHARREWSLPINNPCELVRKPAKPLGRSRLLSDDEETTLLAELQPIWRRSPWMAPLVRLALETAMRRGELLGLRWENIDLNRQIAFLPMTKNGSPRTVPLSRKAITILAELPRCDDGRVLPLSEMGMEAAFRKACARAEIVDLHFHDLRHTATSRLAEKLPNVIELAAVTGHQTIQMLKRYYHPKAEALAKKLD